MWGIVSHHPSHIICNLTICNLTLSLDNHLISLNDNLILDFAIAPHCNPWVCSVCMCDFPIIVFMKMIGKPTCNYISKWVSIVGQPLGLRNHSDLKKSLIWTWTMEVSRLMKKTAVRVVSPCEMTASCLKLKGCWNSWGKKGLAGIGSCWWIEQATGPMDNPIW